MRVATLPVLALGILIVSLVSCQKETSEENGLLPGQAINTSNCKACAYFPWCDQSVYTFSDTITGAGVSTSVKVLTVSGDTLIAGTTYDVSNFGSTGTVFHNCAAGVTSNLTPTPVGQTQDIPLKESAAVGEEWSVIQTIAGVSTTYKYSMVAKGISRTVAGVIFPDVLQIHKITQTVVAGVPFTTFVEDLFYGRAVGLIEHITYDGVSGSQVAHSVLVNYNVP